MLFRRVVQRHAKRNARDATLAGWSVVPPRHATHRAGPPRQSRTCGFSAAGQVIARKISFMVKRKILFF
jgi:hypothetical protein